MAYRDYYAVLGVAKDATQDEINAAYRKLARTYHPDISKLEDAEERFKELGSAHDVLRDPDKRKLYDQYGEQWKAVSEGRAAPPGAERARDDFRTEDFNPDDLSDLGSIFEQFFGGGGGDGAGRARWQSWNAADPGIDVEARLELGVEEAFQGGERALTLQDPEAGQPRRYQVKIPAGVRSGQKIRLAGQGRGKGGERGDLFLVVHVISTERFELRGSDVYTTLDIAPWEAALGCSAKMAVLDGHVTVKVPGGSSSGREIRLTGQGYPQTDGKRGDLYAEIRIRVPTDLGDEERALFEKLSQVSGFRARPQVEEK